MSRAILVGPIHLCYPLLFLYLTFDLLLLIYPSISQDLSRALQESELYNI